MLRHARTTVAVTCSRSGLTGLLLLESNLAAAAAAPAAGFSAAAAAHPQHTATEDSPGAVDAFSQLAGDASETYRPISGSVLKRHGRDLTADAAAGRLDPLIGREDVIERALQVLLRRTKNNPVLIGDPGVGKTAVAEGIAQLIVSPVAPPGLGNRSLIALDVGSLVAGTQYRGAFEERITALLNEVRMAAGRIILFIDELHMLMDAGRVEGGMNAANLLKPALARGDLHCIGATTVEEYRKHIEQDGAFARRFQPVMVEEPTPEQAVVWMHGLRQRYERYHGVRFTDAALETAVKAAQRYIPDRHLPDSAIDVIDEAAARTRLHAAAAAAAAVVRQAATAAAAAQQAAAMAAAAGLPFEVSKVVNSSSGGGGGGGTSSTAAALTAASSSSSSSSGFAEEPRSADPEAARRQMEWLAAAQQPPPPPLQQPQVSGGSSGVFQQPQLPVTGSLAAAMVHRLQASTGLAAQQVTYLSCPHCGTLAMPAPGSATVTCSRCRFTYLTIPQEKLLLGASLFMDQQRRRPGHPPPGAAAAATGPAAAGAAAGPPLAAAGPAAAASAWLGPHAASAAAAAAAGRPAGTLATAAAASAGAGAAAAAAIAAAGPPAQLPVVDVAEVLAVVAEASGIPIKHISQTDWQPLADLERRLRRRVAGQDAAVAAVVGAVRLGRLGLQRGRRPLASLLLTGPAGVGRSTLCLSLAEALFGSDRHLLRFNMAEYGDRASVSRLVGAPPGYVGYGDGGLLTDAVRRRPHSVVLLERVDRAHPEVASLITQVLESGQLQDSMGKRCSFQNVVLVLSTSPTNVRLPASWAAPAAAAAADEAAGADGSSCTGGSSSSGGGGSGSSSEAISVFVPEGHVHPEAHAGDSSRGGSTHSGHSASAQCLQPEDSSGSGGGREGTQQQQRRQPPVHPLRHLPAELLGRVDAAVSMQPLQAADMARIVEIQLAECQLALSQQGIELQVEPDAQQWLAAHGLSPVSGAQRLQPLLREQLLLPVAEVLLRQRMQQQQQQQAGAEAAAGLAVTASLAPGGTRLIVA